MPRKLLQRNSSLPYHVTARSNNRETFPIDLGRLWKVVGFECLVLSTVYEIEVQALVLMPNHIHMLLTVPKYDLGKVMDVFMSSVTRTANTLSGRSGHLFGGPYYGSLITGTRYYGHALKYVYRNPVKAKLCEWVEDYPYSSLHGLLGKSHLPFPICQTRNGLEVNLPAIEAQQQLEWLNRAFPNEADALIRKGLRKRTFDTILDRKTRRPVQLLSQLI
jgi:putative transposase